MAGRRGHGEGTITKRKDGRWESKLDLGWSDGGRKRKTFYGRTQREVQDKLAEARQHLGDGIFVTAPQQSMEQYLRRWLEDTARYTLRSRTYVRYQQLVELHALPMLGRVALSKLTPQQLNQLYGKKLSEGLSPRTVQFLHAVLHRALRQAVKWNLIVRNPSDAVDVPTPKRQEIRPLTPDQARKLMQVVSGDHLEALYVLALTTGMRQGELLALRWSNLDLDGARLEVRHTLQRLPGEWSFEEPKTGRSRRQIRLSIAAVSALRAHRSRQLETRLSAGPHWVAHDLVFCNEIGEPLDGRHITGRELKLLLERAELPKIRFHDLRHTAATLLLAMGEHPKVVQEMLGHSTISLTLDVYSHILPTMQEQAPARMDKVLSATS